jgi:hypothetical protein
LPKSKRAKQAALNHNLMAPSGLQAHNQNYAGLPPGIAPK